jgi:hypothetical protein
MANPIPGSDDLIIKHREDNFLVPLPEPHNAEIPEILDKNNINIP